MTEPHWNEIRRLDDFNRDCYRTDLTELPSGEWYWHLYFRGEKVNGGLSSYKDAARSDAKTASYSHSRNEWLKVYTWDTETGAWIPRGK